MASMPNHQVFTEPWGHRGQVADFGGLLSTASAQTNLDATSADVRTHTQSPIVTGTSVIGLKYKDGVMLAADNLASYGSMARFRDIERIIRVGDSTIVGMGGDISDMQYLERLLDDLTIMERDADDAHSLGPRQVHEYLSRVMYNRRSRMNPLWNAIIVAGICTTTKQIDVAAMTPMLAPQAGSFMAFVDLLGTTYSSPVIATGMGSAMAIPLLRKATDGEAWKELTAEDARRVIDDCMKVLFYRDARSLNKFTVAQVSDQGIIFTRDQTVATDWHFAEKQYGYK